MGKYRLSKASDGQYIWVLKGANGETVLTSERYTTKGAAIGGISSCRENSPVDARYRRLTSQRGLQYFTLTGRNGETIGTGEEYSSAQARDAGIEACKRLGPTSPVDDQTGER